MTDRVCRCGHLETDHDAETGVCVEVSPDPCWCERFDPIDEPANND